MRRVTKADRERFRKQVQREFPDDEMMQEIHFIRLIHHHLLRGLSVRERVRFFNTPQEPQEASGGRGRGAVRGV